MIAEPLVQVRCAVCAGDRTELICTAREVETHLEYLRRFHQRRLAPEAPHGELADRSDFTQGYATDLVACTGCGLVFRNPRPSAEALERAYAQDHYGRERLETLALTQQDLYRPKVRQLRDWLGNRAKVLEVGSFVGGFLSAGREAGWEMLGVDPGEEVTEYCRSRSLPVFRGTLEELPGSRLSEDWASGTVDCIAIWNTFDQVPEPDKLLAQVRRLLRAGGILALRVPNGECFRRSVEWMRRLPHPVDGWLRAVLAWNNLMAFPYLQGYTVRTLDWLCSWHSLERVLVVPDTLVRLADEATQPWARWEETGLKLVTRTAARYAAGRRDPNLALAPWFDAYYTLRS